MISEEEQLKEMRIEILEDSSDKSQDEIFKLKYILPKAQYFILKKAGFPYFSSLQTSSKSFIKLSISSSLGVLTPLAKA